MEGQWETEEPYIDLTIEELVGRPTFKESRDDLGSATVGARIPQWLSRKITKLIEMSGSPYELKSDVVRDALYLGMEVLRLRYKYKWAAESKLSDVVDTVGELDRMEQRFSELVSGLDKLIAAGDTSKAVSLLTEYVLAVSTIEDPWRKMRSLQQLKGSRIVSDLMKHCSERIRSIVSE